MKPFTDFRFLWPPRPTSAVTPMQIAFFERRGYQAQFKLNGTCVVIGIGPDDCSCPIHLEVWNRHKEPAKWRPPDIRSVLRTMFPFQGWNVFVAELLHSKVSDGPKNTIYIHDLLVQDGVYLIGVNYASRHGLLREAAARVISSDFRDPGESASSIAISDIPGILPVSENVWLALNLPDAGTAFASIEPGGIKEGIVLKNPSAILEDCDKQSANSGWSVKIRYANKAAAF